MPGSNPIINKKMIEEDYRVENMLDISSELNKIEKILGILNETSIVGLLGQYGSGKSTALFHLSATKDTSESWVWFDTWKYPDRQNLWEGFVLDFAEQIAPQDFKKVLQALDGTKGDALQTLIKVIGNGANLILPGSGSTVSKLAYFAQTSPAKRVFQIQNLLKMIITKHNKPIRIVVEDIDRSQDMGIFFLETLNNFLKSNSFDTDIKVIVPMSKEKYDKNKESYKKCVDYVRYFSPTLKTENFVAHLLNEEAFDKLQSIPSFNMSNTEVIRQISIFLDEYTQKQQMTFRDLKAFLRNWYSRYLELSNDFDIVDWRVLLCGQARDADAIKSHIHSNMLSSPEIYRDFLASINAGVGDYKATDGKAIVNFNFNIRMSIDPSAALVPVFNQGRDENYSTIINIPREYFI